MPLPPLSFRHEIIDAAPPGAQHDITLLADINGNGRTDIIIGGKKGPPNLFWYENNSWERHDIADTPELEAGGVVCDITGNGRLDIVAGQQLHHHNLYWFENPSDPTQPWQARVIENRFNKYHDQAFGDIDHDGKPELVFASQRSQILAYYDIPEYPYVEPWPEECFHLIADNTGDTIEGLRIVDFGDGNGPCLLAGPNIFRMQDNGRWTRTAFAMDYIMTRTAMADFTGKGGLAVVLAEGESNPGRLAICCGPYLEPIVLRDDLFHPHSLEVADFDGNGLPDIFVAEMGLGSNPNPRMFVLRNHGNGSFEHVIIQEGIPTHEAKVTDMTGNGLPDIVSKPYDPERHIDMWINETGA